MAEVNSTSHQPPPLLPDNLYAAPATDGLSSQAGIDQLEVLLGEVQWPLTLTFKIVTLVPQVKIRDANGRELLYSRQKLFKFREHLQLYTDSTRQQQLADIHANKVIDWSARYAFTDAWGAPIGQVGRKGWRSIWRAHYEVFNPGDEIPDYTLREENPWSKFFDSLLGELPLVGMLSGYLFHPRYSATDRHGQVVMRLAKRRAFFEGKFLIEKTGEISTRQAVALVLSFLMLISLERRRG